VKKLFFSTLKGERGEELSAEWECDFWTHKW